MVVCRFWDRTWKHFRESKIFFSQNLTYSYSFLGWNLPRITMSSESLHNCFGITVKSGKNDEKFGFCEFWPWCRNNDEMIVTLRWSPVNFTAKNTMINFFFHKKKKIPSDIPKWSFSDFETEAEAPFGNRYFFFLKIQLTRTVLWGEIYRELPCHRNHYIIISGSRSKVEKTMKKSVFLEFWLWYRNNDEMIETSR